MFSRYNYLTETWNQMQGICIFHAIEKHIVSKTNYIDSPTTPLPSGAGGVSASSRRRLSSLELFKIQEACRTICCYKINSSWFLDPIHYQLHYSTFLTPLRTSSASHLPGSLAPPLCGMPRSCSLQLVKTIAQWDYLKYVIPYMFLLWLKLVVKLKWNHLRIGRRPAETDVLPSPRPRGNWTCVR